MLSGCFFTSNDLKTKYKKYQVHIKVTEKQRDKLIHLKGLNRANKIVDFEAADFWGAYYDIHIGDSVCKNYGETELRVIKKDTTLVFPLVWGGKVIK